LPSTEIEKPLKQKDIYLIAEQSVGWRFSCAGCEPRRRARLRRKAVHAGLVDVHHGAELFRQWRL